MIYFFYNLLTSLLSPFVRIYLNFRISKGKEIENRTNERLGFSKHKRENGFVVWIHAASVGETLASIPILNYLSNKKEISSILFTTVTTTSAKIVENKLPKKTVHQFFPLDISSFTKRFLLHWKPNLILWMESEIWPNFINNASKMKIPMIVLNGRMSTKAYRRWSLVRNFSRKIMKNLNLCLAQSKKSANYFKNLGLNNIIITGNLKYCTHPLPVKKDTLEEINKIFDKRFVFLAASTHRGEEKICFEMQKKLRKEVNELITIIVPRHPQRAEELIKLSEEYGLKISQRSKKQPVDPNTDLYLCDTIGELGLFYRSANLVFVGGSLIEHGGQNPIEALHHNTEILHGPNIENFEEIYDTLKRINVAFTVTSQKEIEQKIKEKYNRDGLKKPSVTNTSFADEGKKVFQKTILEIDKFLPKKHHD